MTCEFRYKVMISKFSDILKVQLPRYLANENTKLCRVKLVKPGPGPGVSLSISGALSDGDFSSPAVQGANVSTTFGSRDSGFNRWVGLTQTDL